MAECKQNLSFKGFTVSCAILCVGRVKIVPVAFKPKFELKVSSLLLLHEIYRE